MIEPKPVVSKLTSKAPGDPMLWEMVDKYDALSWELRDLKAAIVKRAIEEYADVPGLVSINWAKLRKLAR